MDYSLGATYDMTDLHSYTAHKNETKPISTIRSFKISIDINKHLEFRNLIRVPEDAVVVGDWLVTVEGLAEVEAVSVLPKSKSRVPTVFQVDMTAFHVDFFAPVEPRRV